MAARPAVDRPQPGGVLRRVRRGRGGSGRTSPDLLAPTNWTRAVCTRRAIGGPVSSVVAVHPAALHRTIAGMTCAFEGSQHACCRDRSWPPRPEAVERHLRCTQYPQFSRRCSSRRWLGGATSCAGRQVPRPCQAQRDGPIYWTTPRHGVRARSVLRLRRCSPGTGRSTTSSETNGAGRQRHGRHRVVPE